MKYRNPTHTHHSPEEMEALLEKLRRAYAQRNPSRIGLPREEAAKFFQATLNDLTQKPIRPLKQEELDAKYLAATAVAQALGFLDIEDCKSELMRQQKAAHSAFRR